MTTVIVNGQNCVVTLYYCYRYCSGSELQIIYRGAEFPDQNCVAGYNLADGQLISYIKSRIRVRVFSIAPPNAGVPPCGTTPPIFLEFNWGFANCYKLYAISNRVFMEACHLGYITCYSYYHVCEDPITHELIVTANSSTNEGFPCSETANWIVPFGDFIRPYMRFCDLTN